MSTDHIDLYYEPSSCNCSNKASYNKAAIRAAVAQCLALAEEGKQVGNDSFPHAYEGYEQFKFKHANAPYFEFPILSNGEVYDGNSSAGTDRVVIGSVTKDYKSASFCGVITHSSAGGEDSFVLCKDSTVNPSGHGKLDAGVGHEQGLPPPPGQELLKAEDVKLAWYKP